MEQLQIIKQGGTLMVDSREVSKMIGKRHDHLIRDIEGYVSILNQTPNLGADQFFIENSYTAGTGKCYKHYLLTRKGCDMVANKMTGEKGVLFTAVYVTKFEEMEKELSKPNSTKLLLQTALEHEEKIESIQSDVNYLKENMRIDGVQEFQIRQKANIKVVKVLGGKKAPAYEELSTKAFSRFWRDFKAHFEIPRYGELPRIKFDEAIEFIDAWQPDTSTRLEIQSKNQQQTIKVVS